MHRNALGAYRFPFCTFVVYTDFRIEPVVPLLHAVNVSKMDADRITLKTFFFIFYPFHFLLGTNIPNIIIYMNIYNVNRFFDFLNFFLLFYGFA